MSTLENMIFDLSEANGTPGAEGEISNIIEKYASIFAEVKRDRFGNITAELPAGEKTILLDAHMDRIGMIVTGIEDGGFCGSQSAEAWTQEFLQPRMSRFGAKSLFTAL